MKTVLYKKTYTVASSINRFLESYFNLQMSHLASDLLDKGLSPIQITNAVETAIKVANLSGIETYKHFMPVYSGIEQEIIQDCKLSHLGYGLVLMNADRNLSVVADFQVSVLKEFLKVDS